VEEVGQVTFNSLEEELLYVLAHELRHIYDGFQPKQITDHEAEVLAELHAMKVLKAWRRKKSREFFNVDRHLVFTSFAT
jgi:hypothetical protein